MHGHDEHVARITPRFIRATLAQIRESRVSDAAGCARLKSSRLGNSYCVHIPAKLWHHCPALHIACAPEAALQTQLALTAPSAHAAIRMCIWWCITFACAAPADIQTASSTAANIFIVVPPL